MSDLTQGQGAAAYDAATTSASRSSFINFPTNSRRELTPYTRREVIKKHRALEANCSFVTRMIRKFARHAVGSGIHFRCLSEDDVFNDAMRRDVEEWWNNAAVYSIDGSVDGWEAKLIAAESIILDGEYNSVMTTHPASGFPAMQPLDVFEIETPWGKDFDARQWDDGIRVNEFERPIEYAIRTLPGLSSNIQGDYRFIPADSMIHIHRRRRARGHRGMPWGYSGLNQGIDALDLNALVTGTAKLHSALAVSVKGTAKRGKKGALNKISNANGETGNSSDVQALEKVFGGGMINYLGESGEMQLHSSQHPGANVMAFIEMLFHQMSVGYDVPFSVMWDMAKAGGTAARYDAEDAQSAFDMMFDTISYKLVRREIIWKVSKAIKEGRLAAPKDPLWYSKLVFRGPRKITVDVGRMATAFKTLTRNAGMSIPRFLEEQGLDADQEMDDHIRFLARTQKKCVEWGVDFSLLYEPTPGSQNVVTVNQNDPNA
jgi:capsid protein